MIVERQTSAIEFLKRPLTYGIAEAVEVMETHISLIFLAGDRALKMKRAVRLPYVDFSTPQLRLAACEKEVALNSKTAPGIYLRTRRITRERNGQLVFNGTGETIDAVVEMVRFGQECLFDRMAVAGKLTPSLMSEVARAVARFHKDAAVIHTGGGAANIQGVLDINEAGFATSHVFQSHEVEVFNAEFRSALKLHAGLLDRRERSGKVRRCHGDLHLRNICLFGGMPRLFDCIEFNDRIATIDVLYDVAFLLMELWHRDLPDFANLVMNRYLDETDDDDGFSLLPFFMAVRAAVRAHVTATQIEESGRDSEDLIAMARSYFDLARTLLEASFPCLVAIGGLSGSGKTTVAEALASHVGSPPGARIFESDRIRKAMFGVSAEDHLGPEAYQPEVSAKVYRELGARAHAVLCEGGAGLVDAVFDRPENRTLIEQAARELRVSFVGVWLDTAPTTLRQRVCQRTGGPSDATVEVLEKQLKRDLGNIEWSRIDAGKLPADIVQVILDLMHVAQKCAAVLG
jgi:aminoglycoside phosphotransferase family enzyme/predicted kinase